METYKDYIICTNTDNLQFARKVNEHEWKYTQAYDPQDLSLGYFEENIDLNEYTNEEKANAI